jgi:methionine synthase II (cobalamin-independent)
VEIPTEPIGSIPRPAELIEAMRGAAERRVS